MAEIFQYQSDPEWGISANGSEFAQTSWSYSHLGIPPIVEGDDGVFMVIEQNDISCDDTASHDSAIQTGPTSFSTNTPANTPYGDQHLASDSVRGYHAFHDEAWYSWPGDFRDARPSSSSLHHWGMHPTSNDPWDPIGLRVGKYDTAFVAFADSPISSEQNSSDMSSGSSPPPQGTAHTPENVKIGSSSFDSAGIADRKEWQWEVISGATHSRPKTGRTTAKETDRHQRRGRRGPLDSQVAKNARIMREIGVCWPCRVSKVKCSPGSPCQTCRDHPESLSHLTYRLCCRSSFADYGALYFPKVLTSHFTKREVKSLITRNVDSFVGAGTTVTVHCGRSFAPMELTAHFFKPKTNTLLFHHYATNSSNERMTRIILRRCAPVGLLGVDIQDLQKKCRSNIASIVSHPDYVRQVTAGGKSGIYRRALQIIHRYSKVEKSYLLDKAIQLHAMQYFMGRILTFTKDSSSMVTKVSRNTLGIDIPPDTVSSRLLNRQLKHAMHILREAQTKTVLEEFERHLKKREQTEWPVSFCVVLILCLCIEDIQMATNNFVNNDSGMSHDLHNESYQTCRELEDKPYRQYTQLFHDMYRSHKQPNGHAIDGGFNPILQVGGYETCWSQDRRDMISSIRQLIKDSEAEMRILSTVSVFDSPRQADHQSLQEDIAARLLSKFLLSFLDGP